MQRGATLSLMTTHNTPLARPMIVMPRQGEPVLHTHNCGTVTKVLAPSGHGRPIRATQDEEAVARLGKYADTCKACEKMGAQS